MNARIAVVGGAGNIGSRAVEALVAEGADVSVVDRQPSRLEAVDFVEADVHDRASLESAIASADLVMNFAGPYYELGTTVAEAAIALGKPYIDVCDDAETTEDLLGLNDRAIEAGVPVIIGAGSSPGVANGFALLVAAGFSALDEVVLTWVVGERGESTRAPLNHFLYGISGDIPIWRGGKRTLVSAFSSESEEEFPFGDPIGPFPVRDVGHPETVTLPLVIPADSIRNKGGVMPRQSAAIFDLLRHLGLTSDTTTQVAGVEIAARDFLTAFLTDRHNERARDHSEDVSALGVRAVGEIGGEKVTRWLSSASFLTVAEGTSLPAAAAAIVVLEEQVMPGAHGPEALDTGTWFKKLAVLAPHVHAQIEIWAGDGDRVVTSLAELAAVGSVGELL